MLREKEYRIKKDYWDNFIKNTKGLKGFMDAIIKASVSVNELKTVALSIWRCK